MTNKNHSSNENHSWFFCKDSIHELNNFSTKVRDLWSRLYVLSESLQIKSLIDTLIDIYYYLLNINWLVWFIVHMGRFNLSGCSPSRVISAKHQRLQTVTLEIYLKTTHNPSLITGVIRAKCIITFILSHVQYSQVIG